MIRTLLRLRMLLMLILLSLVKTSLKATDENEVLSDFSPRKIIPLNFVREGREGTERAENSLTANLRFSRPFWIKHKF